LPPATVTELKSVFAEHEAEPPLLVDTDAVLSLAISIMRRAPPAHGTSTIIVRHAVPRIREIISSDTFLAHDCACYPIGLRFQGARLGGGSSAAKARASLTATVPIAVSPASDNRAMKKS
jgi:hypothetical protein